MEKQTKRKPTGAAAMGAGPGRPKGVPNKNTTLLKDAILSAAQQVGEDGAGKDGLVGYLVAVAKSDMKAFAGLLGKVLPIQLTGEGGAAIIIQAGPLDERL
jgi:hypothetical protein